MKKNILKKRTPKERKKSLIMLTMMKKVKIIGEKRKESYA